MPAHITAEESVLIRTLCDMAQAYVTIEELPKDENVALNLRHPWIRQVPDGNYSDVECNIWSMFTECIRLGVKLERRKRGEKETVFTAGTCI